MKSPIPVYQRKMSALSYFVLFILLKGLTSLNVLTPKEILVPSGINSSIVLNCTYTGETYQKIYVIKWFKIIPGENITETLMATFTPLQTEYFDEDVKNRSRLVTYGPNSSSAIMYIRDVRCEDGGDYRCKLTRNSPVDSTSDTSVFLEVEAETPTDFTMQPNTSLEENYIVNFTCSANVGNPPGVLRIWKQRNGIAELNYKTSSLETNKENCSTIAHLTIPYKVTRHDQGAIFWCTSENKLIEVAKRSTEIGPLNISYGPSDVSIAISPDKTSFVAGDKVSLTCTSDGNPPPTFQWTFNFTEVINGGKYNLSEKNSKLGFNIDNITDNGYYHCFASNTINGKPSNTSVNVTITVQEKIVSQPETANSCSETLCSFFEKCSGKNDTAICSTDVWKVIAFVFIAVNLVLGMTSISLCLSWRFNKHKIRQFSSGNTMSDVLISKSPIKFEDFGGYADPKDVKRPETNIKSDNDGRDNPYADPLDTNTMYTFVQKNYENPVKSSSPSDTTLQSLANSQGPDSTCNHVNSSSPGDVSDNCPKPPNVYDDAWV